VFKILPLRYSEEQTVVVHAGTEATLRGCVNDVTSINEILTTYYGFPQQNVRILIDTDPSKEQPTGVNVKKHLKDLVAQSKPGDVLVFHYSGHGTQVCI
jgi:uncharacterized caspase-like protein